MKGEYPPSRHAIGKGSSEPVINVAYQLGPGIGRAQKRWAFEIDPSVIIMTLGRSAAVREVKPSVQRRQRLAPALCKKAESGVVSVEVDDVRTIGGPAPSDAVIEMIGQRSYKWGSSARSLAGCPQCFCSLLIAAGWRTE